MHYSHFNIHVHVDTSAGIRLFSLLLHNFIYTIYIYIYIQYLIEFMNVMLFGNNYSAPDNFLKYCCILWMWKCAIVSLSVELAW